MSLLGALPLLLMLAGPPRPARPGESMLVDALVRGDASAALAALGDATTSEARAIRAAVYDVTGDPRVRDERAGLPPPPTTPLLPARRPPTAGGTAFVAASTARIRSAPRATASVRGTAAIGTPVRVRAIEAGFARVQTGRRTFLVEDVGRPARILAPGAPPDTADGTDGFIAVELLDGVVPDAAALRDDARKADLGGDALRASALWSRVVALEPHDVDARRALIASALRGGLASVAVQAGLLSVDVPWVMDGPPWEVETSGALALAAGCRGDLARAAFVGESDASKAPRDACLVDLDVRDACEPRDTRPDPAMTPPGEEDAFQEGLAREKEKHAIDVKKRRDAVDKLRARFPFGPRLVVDLRRTATTPWPSLYLTAAPLIPVEAGCGADVATIGPVTTTKLLLPRILDEEGAVRVVIPVRALEGAAWAIEGSRQGVPLENAVLIDAVSTNTTEAAFVPLADATLAHRAPRPVFHELAAASTDGELPLVRIALPSFCAVNTCVP